MSYLLWMVYFQVLVFKSFMVRQLSEFITALRQTGEFAGRF